MNTSPAYTDTCPDTRPRYVWQGLAVGLIVACLFLLTSVGALANSVVIRDQLGVLNRSRVQSAASSLPYPVSIYTTSYSGSNSAFDQQAKNTLGSQSNAIVMAFNQHHVAIVYGRNVPLSSSETQDAVNTFTSSLGGNRNYTNATVAALNSLQGSLQGSNSGARSAGGGISFFGTVCLIGLVVIALLIVFAVIRRRQTPGGFGGLGNRFGRNVPPAGYSNGYPPNYQGPYPPNYQGPYPPNYQGPYPPNYPAGQQQGMNPWAAGGLGAAAGGILGYELGKDAGERRDEGRDRDDYGDGGFGGGASGDFGGGDGGFGGGASGDFGGGGGGNDDSGFGGGAGGDFGGGNDDSGFGGGAGGNF